MANLRAVLASLLIAGSMALGGCAETELVTHAAKQIGAPKSTGTYKVGKPYQIFGVWYHPREDPGYDEVGIASWYGPGFQGLKTANGETFDMNELTAAHTTLPMPSFVRVTNLGNGRSLVLRVNDRGPFASSRIIDVSRRAAQLLGFIGPGTAKVRVQAVAAPDEGDPNQAVAVAEPAEATMGAVATSVMTLANIAPGAGEDGVYIQAGAFADPANAETARLKIAHIGATTVTEIIAEGGALYRVRLGPYAGFEAAVAALDQVWAAGLSGARLVGE